MSATGDTAVRIALVYPDLLGTYGDGGNARILAQRLRWRDIPVDVIAVTLDTPLPAQCDLYVLGGGEDAPQGLAAAQLRREGALSAAVAGGAFVFAVCAGVQVLGTRFLTADGLQDGVGLVDLETVRGLPRRAVGELVVTPEPSLGLPVLSGYENHAGMTRLGGGVAPLGRVATGVGNGDGSGGDGFVSDRLLGTYMHGPALARNPELADLILRKVVGELPVGSGHDELAAADEEAAGLRRERLAAVGERHAAAAAGGPWRRWRRA